MKAETNTPWKQHSAGKSERSLVAWHIVAATLAWTGAVLLISSLVNVSARHFQKTQWPDGTQLQDDRSLADVPWLDEGTAKHVHLWLSRHDEDTRSTASTAAHDAGTTTPGRGRHFCACVARSHVESNAICARIFTAIVMEFLDNIWHCQPGKWPVQDQNSLL